MDKDKLESPQSFSFERYVSQGWKLWLKYFEFYLTATEKNRKMFKTSFLLSCTSLFSFFDFFLIRKIFIRK